MHSLSCCSRCVCIGFIYMLLLLLRLELTVVQTGLKFLGSGDPLTSASGMARNERCVQKVLIMCCKSQGNYHSSLLCFETGPIAQADPEPPK